MSSQKLPADYYSRHEIFAAIVPPGNGFNMSKGNSTRFQQGSKLPTN